MDKDRQIRFLYPPLIFICSILLGLWMGGTEELKCTISSFFKNDNNTNIAIALIGASSIVLVLGFLIGTITILLLRTIFCWNRFNYEFYFQGMTYDKIGKLLLKDKTEKITDKQKMYAAVVFDHSYIPDNIHRWMIRRWNSFMIGSFSTVALASSLLIGHCVLDISYKTGWVIPVIIFIAFFIIQAWSSWVESMRMLDFMTGVEKKGDEAEKSDTSDKGID